MGKLSYTTAQIDAKLAPVKHKTVTIAANSWTASGGLFVRDVSDSDIVDGCEVIVCASVATQEIADDAGIYADCQAAVGKFTLTANKVPQGAITIKYTIKL